MNVAVFGYRDGSTIIEALEGLNIKVKYLTDNQLPSENGGGGIQLS